MAIFARKKVLLVKLETTYGTDAAPTGAANAVLARNVRITPIEQMIEERGVVTDGNYGGTEQIVAGDYVKIEFEVEAAGSGAAGTAPAYGPLLRACGRAETVTATVKVDYKLVSAGFESATVYFHVDGKLYKLLGARGSVTFRLNSKGIPVFVFLLTGLYAAVADGANPTPTLTGFKAPLAANRANTPTFTVHGYAAKLASIECADNNEVVYRNLIGEESVQIVDRKPAGRLTIEDVPVATKDFVGIARAGTKGTLQLIHGTTAGYKVQMDATSVQLLKPTVDAVDGIQMLGLDLLLLPSAGNDELTITVL